MKNENKIISVKAMLSDLETYVGELDEIEKQEKLAEEKRIEEGFKLGMRGIRILKAIKAIPEIKRYSHHQTVGCGLGRNHWDNNLSVNYSFLLKRGKLYYESRARDFRIFDEEKVHPLYRMWYVEEREDFGEWDPSISSLELTGKIGFEEMLRLVLEDINDRKRQ